MKSRILIVMFLFLSIIFLVSCIFDNPIQPETTEALTNAPTQEPVAITPQQTDILPRGQVVTSQHIDNTEGNYTVPFPDSWFGKVSYEILGTNTYIYHITKDASQPSINPLILHIDSSCTIASDTPGVNIFLEAGDYKIYQVLNLESPYMTDTEDEAEFLDLYADIPLILQNVWMIDDSIWQTQINNPTPPPVLATPFTQHDCQLATALVGQSNIATTLSAIGETPISTETITWGATGQVEEKYEFSFGRISFLDGVLAMVAIENGTIAGPRGFSVGDHIDDVLASFVSTLELDNSDYTIYYRRNSLDTDMIFLPPAAVVHKNAGGLSILSLSCFDVGEDLSGMNNDDLKDYYIYMAYYSCSFHYGSDGIITKITMNNVADAE